MQFIREDVEVAVRDLGARLIAALSERKRVLWLTSGGSNLPLTARIMASVPVELTKLLTIMPVDERYGPVGHENSNVQQLMDAGFEPAQATLIPALTGATLAMTLDRYNTAIEDAFTKNDFIVAQLGMGSDGHVAGILPHSPAAASQALVAAYEGPDYSRITLTFPALLRCSEAYLFAYGAGKRDQLLRLRDETMPLADQPAQILKAIAQSYIYNDQID